MRKTFLMLIFICGLTFAQNTKTGEGSLAHVTTGYSNNAYGLNSLYWLTTGYKNISIGDYNLSTLTTGYKNIYIGYGLIADSVNQFNTLNIGGIIKGDLSSGLVTIPTLAGTTLTQDSLKTRAFVLGSTNITTTGTKLNYLTSVSGTTGTTSTNIVFSTSPTITTPTFNGSFSTDSTISGSASFDSTDATDTVVVVGASVTDKYYVILTGTSAPAAQDAFVVGATATGFVIKRSSGGTNNLAYNWLRIK